MTDRRPDRPFLVLASALGTSPSSVFGPLLPDLEVGCNVLGLVMPGHTGFEPVDSALSLEDVATEVGQHLTEFGISRYFFAGLSIGSAVGITLAAANARDPQLRGLVLMGALPRYGSPSVWEDRAKSVRDSGMGLLRDFLAPRWFTAKLQAEHPDWVEAVLADVERCHPSGYIASCLALADYDARELLARITAPTSLVIGLHDEVAPPQQSLVMAAEIPSITDSCLIAPGAHILPLESPRRVARAILDIVSASSDD